MGFDLFDDILDNSYDLELDPKVRIDKIITNLINLKSVDLNDYFKNNKIRFINNRNLILKLAFSNGLNDTFKLINFLNI
jgi:hypothetical protein